MKVILLKDVKEQGKKDDIIEVSDGFAQNFLIKRGLAKSVSSSGLNEIAQRKAADEKKLELEKLAAAELFEKLNGSTISVKVKCGESGKLFGSVTNKEIAETLIAAGYDIDKRRVILKDPIKQLGRVMIEVKLYLGITAKVNVNVEAK